MNILEKSLPPELNADNYQQDSTIDFRDKRVKSNQKQYQLLPYYIWTLLIIIYF